MFGFNLVTMFGEVLDDPIEFVAHAQRCCGFRLKAEYGNKQIVIWCFSRGNAYHVTSSYKLRAGHFILFHGALFGAFANWMEAVGEEGKWRVALHGRVYTQFEAARVLGSDHALASCVITGMVVPGIIRAKHDGREVLIFHMSCDTAIMSYDESKVARHSMVMSFSATAYDDVKENVVPGAILLCRGYLFQNRKNRIMVACLQTESLGVVQNELTDRYKNEPVYVPWEKVKEKTEAKRFSGVKREPTKYPW